MNRAQTDRGFTLLELMLVTALIALLSAFAIPAYRGYLDRANHSRAISDIGMISLDLYRWELNTGSFPADLAAAGLAGFSDPWGRPYAYLNIQTANQNEVRKDKNLHPLNTDFDLYSVGKDGRSRLPLTAQQSRDDVIRANNGGFIGRAEEY
jgi:general secretion pathway protein G